MTGTAIRAETAIRGWAFNARNVLFISLALFGLAGCTAEPIWAPEEQVQRAAYVHPGPKTITLVTVINNRSQSGAHSGLMINGSQRVIFDPAGTFRHPSIPERNDVQLGIRPPILNLYIDYHARDTFHVVLQEIEVTPEVAERALQTVQNYGAVPKAMCSNAISRVLAQIPGFESVGHSFFPAKTMNKFAELPNVKTSRVFDDRPKGSTASTAELVYQ
jgi:hypothetical protein